MRLLFFIYWTLLFHFTLSGQGLISISQIHSIPVNASINDIILEQDIAYVASDKGLFKISIDNLEAELVNPNPCDKLLMTNQKNLWASFSQSYLQNMKDGSKIEYQHESIEINDLEWYNGKIWIASNKGILSVNTKTNELLNQINSRNSSLINDKINFLHLDDQEIMWIGTDEGILFINQKGKWKLYEKKLSMESMHYNHEGLWLVSNKEMWVIDPFNRWYPAAINKGLRKGRIRDITADSTGRLYMASDILVRYDPYKEEIESFSETPGLISRQCNTIESDKDNRVWIGTLNSGLFLMGFKEEARKIDLSALCIIKKNIDCEGEKAEVKLNITGGAPPYSVSWAHDNSSDMSKNLAPGDYTIKVSDLTGEQTETSITLKRKSPINVAILNTTPESKDGAGDATVKLKITGGTAPYRVRWDNGERGEMANNLKTGIQSFRVEDSNGCLFESSVLIKPQLILPDLEIGKLTVGQTLRINKLFFEADSSVVKDESFEALDEIYNFLIAHPSVVVEIGGHTNNIPSHDYCDKLSTARARSVAEYLYQKGIPENRISYIGYGKRQPIATNKSKSGRLKNQRVELKIIQMGE